LIGLCNVEDVISLVDILLLSVLKSWLVET